MTDNQSVRAAARHIPAMIFAATVVLNAVLIGVLVHQSLTPPFSAASAHLARIEPAPAQPPSIDGAPDHQLPSEVTVADGAVPDGVTVFDDEIPAVANLAPGLLAALRQAA